MGTDFVLTTYLQGGGTSWIFEIFLYDHKDKRELSKVSDHLSHPGNHALER